MVRSAGAVSRMAPKLSSVPASGGAGVRVYSATKTLSFRVDEMRRDDLDLHLLPLHGADGAHDLAHALMPALDEAQPDGMAQVGRVGHRGHPALVVVHVGRLALGDEMRPGDKF